MKKKVISALLVSLLILMMIGCRAEEPTQDEVPQATETAQVEQTAPVESSEPIEPSEKVAEAEPMKAVLQDATQEDMIKIFESAYGSGNAIREFSDDEDFILSTELDALHRYMRLLDTVNYPADMENQYFAWCEANKAENDGQLFNDCNELVYATGTVNIRASYSINSDKLGSLTRGQSLTRTGIGIDGTEADGWSRVQLADGTTAYMVGSYLSTTQPTTQGAQGNGTPNTGNTQTDPGGTTIVNDPTFTSGEGEAPKADFDQLHNATDLGFRPIGPGEIEYGGN